MATAAAEDTGAFQIPETLDEKLEEARRLSERLQKTAERIENGIARRSGLIPLAIALLPPAADCHLLKT